MMRFMFVPQGGSLRVVCRLIPILVGLSIGAVGEDAASEPRVKLRIDASPLDATVRQATSLAPIVRAATPSVVSVATTRFVSAASRPGRPFHFFFKDPEDETREDKGEGSARRVPIESMGSGVIVTEDGYILTNTHVVESVDEISVLLDDGETEYEARVVGKDDLTDVAVLKVDAIGLPAITLGDPTTLEVGDLVLAIGSPFGLGQTVTSGIVSAKGRSGFYLRYEDFIQTDAPVNPGNSGGALVDAQGRLVGINTMIMSEIGVSAGVSFAIPANLAQFVLEKVVRDGRVHRGYLGVELAERVDQLLADELELPGTEGALVTRTRPDEPAAQAGMEAGDFIIQFNGVRIKDRRHLQFEVAKAEPETTATLQVVRNGKSQTLHLTLGELDTALFARRTEPARRNVPDLLEGLELTDLTSETRRELGIPDTVEHGVLVARVDPHSPAYRAGLREGTLVLEVRRTEVASKEQLLDEASRGGADRLLLRVRDPEGGTRYLVLTR